MSRLGPKLLITVKISRFGGTLSDLQIPYGRPLIHVKPSRFGGRLPIYRPLKVGVVLCTFFLFEELASLLMYASRISLCLLDIYLQLSCVNYKCKSLCKFIVLYRTLGTLLSMVAFFSMHYFISFSYS